MHIPDELRHYLALLGSNSALQQIAPLLVIILVPWLVLSARPLITSLFRSCLMVLETLALALPWNWFGSAPSSSKKPKKKLLRTRAEQQNALNGDAVRRKDGYRDDGYYPGIVNISGTYCFMDSTLQALASLSYLQPHIEQIHEKAEALDVPTPVIDALLAILRDLNHSKSSPRAIRPVQMIQALVDFSRSKQNHLFSSRQHQDAQELFQLISECIKTETAAVDKEGHRDRGLGALSHHSGKFHREIGKSVFDGLTANRRSCKRCGYTEAVMHFAFDSWQLTVPRAGACRLDECLQEYTQLEELDDCVCRKCSLTVTLDRLAIEANKLTAATAPGTNASSSQKKKAREARKLELRLKLALEEGRIEEDIKGVKVDRVISRSTKQAMIARPPPVLALHLNRSIHYGFGVSKNNCQVLFPEFLDLTPFTTSGRLSTIPDSPISTPPPALPRSTTPTPETYATPRTLYRLSAVVCHYGQHSFGHYVCYRRKPRPEAFGPNRFAPPRLACPWGCTCEKCQLYGPVRDDFGVPDGNADADEDATLINSSTSPTPTPSAPPPTPMHTPGRGWLRISDDSVKECGIETVLSERSGAFMLYYERVVLPGVYLETTPKSSEETLRPKDHPIEQQHILRRHNNESVSSFSVRNVKNGYQDLSSSSLSSLASSSSDLGSRIGSASEEAEVKKGEASVNGYGHTNGFVVAPVPRKGTIGPRVVRNVSMQRKRSNSVPPLESGSSPLLNGSFVSSSPSSTAPISSNVNSAEKVQGQGSESRKSKSNGSRKGKEVNGEIGNGIEGHGGMTGSMLDLRTSTTSVSPDTANVNGTTGNRIVNGAPSETGTAPSLSPISSPAREGRPQMNGDARRPSQSSSVRSRSSSKSRKPISHASVSAKMASMGMGPGMSMTGTVERITIPISSLGSPTAISSSSVAPVSGTTKSSSSGSSSKSSKSKSRVVSNGSAIPASSS